MILGIGTDVVAPPRLLAAYGRHGEAFLRRLFAPDEITAITAAPARMAARMATRFAAKEACIKAMGAKIGRAGQWTDIAVISHPSGQPALHLSGAASAHLASLTPMGYKAQLHLSLSDADDLAVAFVVISAVKEP